MHTKHVPGIDLATIRILGQTVFLEIVQANTRGAHMMVVADLIRLLTMTVKSASLSLMVSKYVPLM